jgi:predicted transcriptional regulator
MQNVEKNIGALVAAESKDAISALDQAIVSKLKLCMTVVEGAAASNIPVASTQKLLQSMSTGLSNIVAGRADMAQTIRVLSSIQKHSNLKTVSYGCPLGMPMEQATATILDNDQLPVGTPA